LYRAHQETDVLLTLTFDYGQRAAVREIERAQALATELSLPHQVIPLPWFKEFTRTALINTSAEIPKDDQVEVGSQEVSERTAKAVWVPNRNGIFLNIAAGFAEGLGASVVIPGFNKEEAATFSDNSAGYMQALDQAFSYSTSNSVIVRCYSVELSKTQIVEQSLKLNVPFSKLWPCYEAFDEWCGSCESCLRFKRALVANKVEGVL
jgi:7-cyano-7-deazaguanine synthase